MVIDKIVDFYDYNGLVSRTFGYLSIVIGSFSAGYYHAQCNKHGVDIAPIKDIALTYGVPAVGTLFGGLIEHKYPEESDRYPWRLGSFCGGAIGGFASVIFGTAGYVTGNLVGK